MRRRPCFTTLVRGCSVCSSTAKHQLPSSSKCHSDTFSSTLLWHTSSSAILFFLHFSPIELQWFQTCSSTSFWPGANLHDCTWTSQLPPTPTVYRFLNSGGYLGEAGDLARVLRAALDLTRKVWQSPDDQSVYASW